MGGLPSDREEALIWRDRDVAMQKRDEQLRAAEAEQLTRAHDMAKSAGIRGGGYGGNCSPKRHDELRDEVGKYCKNSGVLSCKNNEIDYGKAEAAEKCLNARAKIAKLCFAGGDNGHQEQIRNMRTIINKCTGAEEK
jgi:hypothetical protein